MDTLKRQIINGYFTEASKILLEWSDKNVNNQNAPKILTLLKALTDIYQYTCQADVEIWANNQELSLQRRGKQNAVMRARKAEEENELLHKQIKELETKLQILL
jgi:hypothetical protein